MLVVPTIRARNWHDDILAHTSKPFLRLLKCPFPGTFAVEKKKIINYARGFEIQLVPKHDSAVLALDNLPKSSTSAGEVTRADRNWDRDIHL